MNKFLYDVRKFIKASQQELWVLAGTLILSIIIDLIYKTIEVARTTATGSFLHALTGFGYIIFSLLVVWKIATTVLFKNIKLFSYDEPHKTTKRKKK